MQIKSYEHIGCQSSLASLVCNLFDKKWLLKDDLKLRHKGFVEAEVVRFVNMQLTSKEVTVLGFAVFAVYLP